MDYNLIVHYSSEKGYFSARKEIEKFLVSLGEKKPVIDKLRDGSVIGIKTNRSVNDLIEELKEKSFANPGEFSATERWIPIEVWCPAGLSRIQREINDMLAQISSGERWSAEIETWGRTPSSDEILQLLKNSIKERFVDEGGSKTVFIEFQGDECAISILKPNDVFVVIQI